MNNRYVQILLFNKDYCIECYLDNRKIHSWTTDNELAMALIIRYWVVCGHKEELIEQLIGDVI